MPAPRTTALDAVALRSFLISEGYDEVEEMAAVLRAFSGGDEGRVQRRPQSIIVEAVCRYYEVTPAELVSQSHRPLPVRASRAAIYLLHTAGGLSYSDAAIAVGTCRRSAIRACQDVDADETLRAEVAEIAREIEQRCESGAGRAPVVWPKKSSGSSNQ